MHESVQLGTAALAVLLIGVSKAGFGGGLGMLNTTLCVMAFGPRDAIGILLPLLCAGDVFSLYHYWGKWRRRDLLLLLPGILAGVIVGVQLIGEFSPRQLNVAIGLLAVGFVVFQWTKPWILRSERSFEPTRWMGFLFGAGAGVTSTFAHGSGPLVTLYLLPQRLPKEVYVSTSVLIFSWINLIKLPFYAGTGIIHAGTAGVSAAFLPLVPLGVWMGVALNRRVPDALFNRCVYVITFLAGLQLLVR